MQWEVQLRLALWYWVPVIAYAGLIVYFSSISSPHGYFPAFFLKLGDKFVHALEYGILGVLCYRTFRQAAGRQAARYAIPFAIIAAAVFGVTDEYHQSFVPSRMADGWDLIADCLGAATAVMVWHTWMKSSRTIHAP